MDKIGQQEIIGKFSIHEALVNSKLWLLKKDEIKKIFKKNLLNTPREQKLVWSDMKTAKLWIPKNSNSEKSFLKLFKCYYHVSLTNVKNIVYCRKSYLL